MTNKTDDLIKHINNLLSDASKNKLMLDTALFELLFCNSTKSEWNNINVLNYERLFNYLKPDIICEKHNVFSIKEIYFTKNDTLIYTFNFNNVLKTVQRKYDE